MPLSCWLAVGTGMLCCSMSCNCSQLPLLTCSVKARLVLDELLGSPARAAPPALNMSSAARYCSMVHLAA